MVLLVYLYYMFFHNVLYYRLNKCDDRDNKEIRKLLKATRHKVTLLKKFIVLIYLMIKTINKHLTPKYNEKKLYGEVFTPTELINDILDELDNYYIKQHNVSIFSISHYKWFDPSNGIGNFLIVIYLRLIKYHSEKHILENMLYSSEINSKNNNIYKEIIDPDNKYHLNYYEGNTLKIDIEKEFKIKGFDIIIGNPPFQKVCNNNKVGGNSLWSDFINYSFNVLNDNGLLLFITPCSWMTGTTNKLSGNILKGVFQKNTLLFLNIETFNRYFKVSSTFSYYLIKKSFEDIDFNCKVKYKNKIYDSVIQQNIFRKLYVVPKLLTNTMLNIINKVENKSDDKFDFKRTYDLDRRKKVFTNSGKYRIRHKAVEILYTDYYQEKCIDKHKVIISMSGYMKPLYDFECGCTDASYYNLVDSKEEAEHLLYLLDTKLYKFIINNYRELTGLNNHNNINRLSICYDKDVYGYFQLTDDEIKLIEINI